MNRYFIYLFSTHGNKAISVGFGKDINKIIAFYKKLPNLFNPTPDFNRLIYLEEVNSKELAELRFNEIFSYSKQGKEILIDNINPNWIELIPGVNIEV